jgi:hypothetical protein
MFTVEMDHDEIAIVILDDRGVHQDVEVFLYEDIVYIRQWNEEIDRYKTIQMSVEMFESFQAALNSPEGAFIIRKQNED